MQKYQICSLNLPFPIPDLVGAGVGDFSGFPEVIFQVL